MNRKRIYNFLKEKVESQEYLITTDDIIPSCIFHSWDKCSENDSVLDIEYTDHVGYNYMFSFYKEDFENAQIDDSSITLINSKKHKVTIEVFKKLSNEDIISDMMTD